VLEGANLAYCAPTSGGKTLCADALLAKRVVETGGKGLFIVPIVTLAEEKSKTLGEVFRAQKLLVEGYYRSKGAGFLDDDPNGGCDVAVCTIEKAYYLLNRVIEKRAMDKICIVVLDEAHMIDSQRGVFVEVILTKVRFLNPKCQIVCLSATMPNPNIFATWLGAQVYSTTFRPVPLTEYFVRGRSKVCLIERAGLPRPRVGTESVVTLPTIDLPKPTTPKAGQPSNRSQLGHVWKICRDAILARKSVLVFCPSKVLCLECAREAVTRIIGDIVLRPIVVFDEPAEIAEVRDKAVACLSKAAAGLDKDMCNMIQHGVAFHHAGLTDEERKQVEFAFRKGGVRLLFATSTLSIGVNLPTSIVIQMAFKMGMTQLDCATYMQMAGRAGRAGHDTSGTSYLFLAGHEEEAAQKVLEEGPRRLRSSLLSHPGSLSQLVLDAIGRAVVTSSESLLEYVRSSLAWASLDSDAERAILLALVEQEVQKLHKEKYFERNEAGQIVLLPLGIATSVTWLKPSEAQQILHDVDNAMSKGFVMLKTLLHAAFLLAPLDFGSHLTLLASSQNKSTETREQMCLRLCKASAEEQRVVCRVFGVEGVDAFKELEIRRMSPQDQNRLLRIFAGMIICDMLKEVELFEVARKYRVEDKDVEWVMEQASANAPQLVAFLQLLGPDHRRFAATFADIVPRLEQGVSPQLVSLMKIPKMNRLRARALYTSGITTAQELADAPLEKVRQVLVDCGPNQNRMNMIESATAKHQATFLEEKAAKSAIKRAREFLEEEKALATEDARTVALTRNRERRRSKAR
jgi:DNA polymerase theta